MGVSCLTDMLLGEGNCSAIETCSPGKAGALTLATIVSWRGGYGYVTGHLPGDEQLPLCRLRYLGFDTDWGFALYQANSETYAVVH
jgi:hypothetical protein